MLRPEAFAYTLMIMQACVVGATLVVAMMTALVAAQLATAPPRGGGGSPFRRAFRCSSTPTGLLTPSLSSFPRSSCRSATFEDQEDWLVRARRNEPREYSRSQWA